TTPAIVCTPTCAYGCRTETDSCRVRPTSQSTTSTSTAPGPSSAPQPPGPWNAIRPAHQPATNTTATTTTAASHSHTRRLRTLRTELTAPLPEISSAQFRASSEYSSSDGGISGQTSPNVFTVSLSIEPGSS